MPNRPRRGEMSGRSSIGLDLGAFSKKPKMSPEAEAKGIKEPFKEPGFFGKLFNPQGARETRAANMEYILNQLDADQKKAVQEALLEKEVDASNRKTDYKAQKDKEVAEHGYGLTEKEIQKRAEEERGNIKARTAGEIEAENVRAANTRAQSFVGAQIKSLGDEGVYPTEKGTQLMEQHADSDIGRNQITDAFMTSVAKTGLGQKTAAADLNEFERLRPAQESKRFAETILGTQKANYDMGRLAKQPTDDREKSDFERTRRSILLEGMKLANEQIPFRNVKVIGEGKQLVNPSTIGQGLTVPRMTLDRTPSGVPFQGIELDPEEEEEYRQMLKGLSQ